MGRSCTVGVLLIFCSTILTKCTSYVIDSTYMDSDENVILPEESYFGYHSGQTSETTTPATETTRTETMLREEDVRALALLNETAARIQDAQFHLYKQKTELSIKSLNGVLPELETIKESLTDLLTSAPGSAHPAGVSFTEFKNRDDALENELSSVNERMDSDRRDIERYSAAYRGVEDTLRVAQQTLEGILLPPLSSVNNSVEDITGSEGVRSVPTFSVGTTEIPTTAPNLSHTGGNISQSCGGSLKSKRGSIMYKLNEDLNPNEGCIWIISTPQSIRSVSLQIKESQFTPNHLTNLAVGYLVDTEYGVSDEFNWQKLNSSNTAPQFIPISARVIFIQFVSSATTETRTNKGFHLDFELDYTNFGAKEPENTILTGSSGTFKYPQNASVYSDYARVVIVIQPTLPNTSLYIKWYGIEARVYNNVYDSLNIWRFETNPLIWQRQEQLYGSRNLNSVSHYARKYSNVGTRNKNPFVLYFKSDASNTGPGFELFWNNSGD